MDFKRLLFSAHLNKDEVLFCTIHRHWIKVMWPMLKIAVFGYLIPVFLLFNFVGLGNTVSLVLYGWMLLAVGYTVYAWFDWYGDAILCTDEGIKTVEWNGFTNQNSTQLDYGNLVIDYGQKGWRQSFLNYGQVSFKNPSGGQVSIQAVDKPLQAVRMITKCQNEMVNAKSIQDAEAMKDILAKVIAEHIRVNS